MEDERVERLSPSGRALWKALRSAMEQLVSGECSEDEIADTMSRLSPESNGFKREDDYVTIDEGMRILHFGRNRAGFCNLMKKYGIPNETFNNVKIGYNRHRLVALKHRLDEECRRRKECREPRQRRMKEIEGTHSIHD